MVEQGRTMVLLLSGLTPRCAHIFPHRCCFQPVRRFRQQMGRTRARTIMERKWCILPYRTGASAELDRPSNPISAAVSDRFRHNSRSDWFFAFLDRFPTPGSITALSKEAFIAAAWNVVGRKVAKERLLGDIYETARASIGLPIPIEAPAVRMFRLVIAEARSLIQQRNTLEAMAVELLHESPDYKLLCRIPGVGPITALTILAEAGDLRRFGHHRQFLKFCGL